MKRDKAEIIAKEKARVMYEYLEKFMEDVDTISGVMEFASSNNRLVVDITIMQDGREVFGRGYDLGISDIYADLLTRELSKLLLDGFMPSENYIISEYAMIKGHPFMSRDGFYVSNAHESRVNVNFRVKGNEFASIIQEHNNRINEYRKSVGAIVR